jgi:hypothetical protein
LAALRAGVGAGELVQTKKSYKISVDFKKKVVAAKKKMEALKKKAEAPEKKTAVKNETTACAGAQKESGSAGKDKTAKPKKVSVQDTFDWVIFNTHNSRH